MANPQFRLGIVPRTVGSGCSQLDSWQEFTSRDLMFEGVDPKGVVVYGTYTQQEPPPCARYPLIAGLPMPPPV
jgi:hypothetical protein